MKRNIYLLLIFVCPIFANAQSQHEDEIAILGKWKMIKMEIKDGMYFDINNRDSSFKRFSEVIAKSQQELPALEGATWLQEAFDKAFEEFKQLFVEFQAAHRYTSNQSSTEGALIVVSGTYSLNIKTQTLTRFEKGNKIDEVLYVLKDDLLILRPVKSENMQSMIVYKKSK
jgi:hypothetical protein